MALEAFNLIGVRYCIKISHQDWNAFGFVVVKDIIELIPELMFTAVNVCSGVSWMVDGAQIENNATR